MSEPERHPPQIERLLELVSARTGVVRRLDRVVRGADEPTPPVLYAATVSNYDFRRVPAAERSAAGKGLTAAAAIGSAIGEAVERYCASHVEPSRLLRTALRDAPDGALAPHELVLFSERQYARPGFPFAAPEPGTAIDWVRAAELGDAGTPIGEAWLPAVAVFLHGNNVLPGDTLFMSNSSGLAAGPDAAAATRSALCELIERDAFVVSWLLRLAPSRIVVDEPAGPLAPIVEHYARFGVELQLHALASDVGVPVVLALALADGPDEPAAVVGLGCHLDATEAALRAAFEIAQIRPSQVEHRRQPRRLGPDDVKTIEDHSAYFAQPSALPELDFIRRTPESVALSALPRLAGADAAADIATCAAALRRIGCRVFACDVTTPDLAPYPIRVVRAVASGLQPIHFGHGMERLGGSRLAETARRLQPGSVPFAEAALNPCPHPLA